MRLGVSYMGHHNPRHLKSDIAEMARLRLDDLLVAAQENDFACFSGKLKLTPQIAKEHGLRPVAVFWGALNLFGGGRSSQFLLEHPEGFQVGRDGSHRPQGCYVNPACVGRIEEMIGVAAGCGFEGYFVDEPTPLLDCFCRACRRKFEEWYGGALTEASEETQLEFRRRCCVDYVKTISEYCKAAHPQLETMCCVMPSDSAMWEAVAAIPALDNLGTDIYWVNNGSDIETMRRSCAASRQPAASAASDITNGSSAGTFAPAARSESFSRGRCSSKNSRMPSTSGPGKGRSAPVKAATTRRLHGRAPARSFVWQRDPARAESRIFRMDPARDYCRAASRARSSRTSSP